MSYEIISNSGKHITTESGKLLRVPFELRHNNKHISYHRSLEAARHQQSVHTRIQAEKKLEQYKFDKLLNEQLKTYNI